MSSMADLPPIHPAPPDFDRWAALHRLLVLSFSGMEGRIDPPSSLTSLSASDLEQMSRTQVLLLGIGASGDPVACAYLRPEPDALYLGKVAIHPDLRGRGLLHHIIAAAHPNTAAKCNLNKCSPKMFAKAQAEGFPPFSVTAHFTEMTRSTFCLVPVGDSPPSSRLYLAVSAGCIPVFISDSFVGAFPHEVPWESFTLRVPEAAETKTYQ